MPNSKGSYVKHKKLLTTFKIVRYVVIFRIENEIPEAYDLLVIIEKNLKFEKK